MILLDTLVEEIKLLLSSNRINDLRQTEIIFREKLQKKPAGLLISLFVQIITDNICFSVEQHKSFLEQIDTIELPNTMVENLMSYYSMLAVVSAYLSESALSSEVANEIAERYLADHTHYKRNYFILYFNVLCYGAKWFYQKENGKTSIVDLSGLKVIRNSKSYFDEIPNRGHKLFIKKNRPSPWINGYDCVMEQIELLSERLEVDGEHLEKRVADYCDKIPDTVQLIKLGRKWRGCRVVCENPNRSFLRVLYKDWYNHKFDWEETELGRIVLSASEPYCLLITPQLWTYNNGYLLNPPESFISSSSVEQKKQIHDILFEGVDDTETVLAGGIIDYTHKEEIFGFMVSYFSIPGLPSKYAAHCYERNSRLLLQSRPDFSEQEHYNITLHHNGIESFQGSNIMCGFSKISLDEFHWHINITVNGMRLFNEGGQEIGRFEYYYGQRGNMGNRYISNQPLLQRWVVSKDAISKARCIVGCPNNIKINHAFDSVIRKYED